MLLWNSAAWAGGDGAIWQPWRDHAQGCYRMRGLLHGQRLRLLLTPTMVTVIQNEAAPKGDRTPCTRRRTAPCLPDSEPEGPPVWYCISIDHYCIHSGKLSVPLLLAWC